MILAPRLNEIIIDQAKRLNYSVADVAPSTFEALKQAANGSGLVIWSGGSDQTIYGDPLINFAFRAWHDSLHLKLNAPFTLDGEIFVAKEQARLVESDLLGKIILAEIQGQAEFLAETGAFVEDQVTFIKNYLKGA